MFVKQIDFDEAMRLAGNGMEIKTLVPTGPGSGWESFEPDTLQNMLADVLFFRTEPAMENSSLEEVQPAKKKPAVPVKKKPAKKVDAGKIIALHKAGWTGKAIADELKISEATVSTYIKKLQEDRNEKVAE